MSLVYFKKGKELNILYWPDFIFKQSKLMNNKQGKELSQEEQEALADQLLANLEADYNYVHQFNMKEAQAPKEKQPGEDKE